ncbi:Ig-like domain-containing protein [Massilia endophytica]|uniref:Ig-like domain-containing protein n=1 Tax=Massilia endophytica TaxID=2899220 RepID=UPI001E54E2B7|nr:Ig-like domain-containing protein [Massilia endophytica]UGQ47002.1 Ig-like domain-containing protein [Massilia endophytica]
MADSSPPILSTSLPVAITMAANGNIELLFNEAVRLGGGKIFITDGVSQTYRARDGSYATRIVGATDTRELDASELFFKEGNTKLVINPASNLDLGATYHLYMEGAAITDMAGNVFAGLRTTAGTSFTTPFTAADVGGPQVVSMSLDKPLIESGASVKPTLTLIFDEAVNGLSLTDFTVAGGTLSNLVQSADGHTWTATLNTTYTESLAGSIVFQKDSVLDALGNSSKIAETIKFGATTDLHITLDWGGDTGIDSDDLITGETVHNILVEPHMSVNEDDQMQLWVNGSWHTMNWVEEEGFNGFRLSEIELSGTGAIKARLLDQYGNERASTERSYVIDTEAPSYSAVDATLALAIGSDTGKEGDSTTQQLRPYIEINLGTTTGLKVGDVISLAEVWDFEGEFINANYPVVSHRLTAADIAAGTLQVQFPEYSEPPEGDFSIKLKVMVSDVAGNRQEEGWHSNQTLELNFDVTQARYNSMSLSPDLTQLHLQFSENVDPGNFRLVKLSDNSYITLTPADYFMDTEAHVLVVTLPSAMTAGAAYRLVNESGIVYDYAGNFTALDHIDFHAFLPITASAYNLQLGTDTGIPDGRTSVANQTLHGDIEGALNTGEFVEVSLDGGETWTHATVSGSTWSLNVTLTGEHYAQVRVSNGESANYATEAYLVLDTTAPAAPGVPELASSSDSGTADGITNLPAPTIVAKVDGMSGVEEGSRVEVLDASDHVLGYHIFDSGDFDYGALSGNPEIVLSTLADGTHSLHTRIVDGAGNVGASSGTLSVTIDTSAPVVGAAPALLAEDDSGISDSDGVTNDNTVTVRASLGTVTGFRVGDVIELVNGNGAAIASHTVVAGDFTAGIVADQDFSVLLGAYEQLAVRVRDVAGNVSTAGAQLTVIVDTTPPSAYLDTASFAFNSSTHIASINLTGDTADTHVEFSQNGGASWFQGTGSGANWTYDTGGAMSVLTMRVVDLAGNVGGGIPSMSAEPDAMIHIASDWNEIISVDSYAALFTRAGDDVISATTAGFTYLDGGSGIDTLNLTAGVTVVAANLANKMVNVEKIQLSGGAGNVFDVSNVAAVQTFGMSTLYIEGASGSLDIGGASAWTLGLDNGGYHTYSASGVTLMVATTINIVGVAGTTS